jgi:hypothetical protein
MDSGLLFDSEYGVSGQTRWLIVDDYTTLDTQQSYSDIIQLVCWRCLMREPRTASDVEGSLSL